MKSGRLALQSSSTLQDLIEFLNTRPCVDQRYHGVLEPQVFRLGPPCHWVLLGALCLSGALACFLETRHASCEGHPTGRAAGDFPPGVDIRGESYYLGCFKLCFPYRL